MKKTLLWVALVAVAAYLLGIFVAAVISGVPSDWLATQSPTGRPPRIVALLTLGPIILVGLVAIGVRLYRRWGPAHVRKRNAAPRRAKG